MKANDFVKEFGLVKAKDVLGGMPDKTATHYVFRKIPNYYSVDFQSWFYDVDWWDSDCNTEQELIDSYGNEFVVNLEELKTVVEAWELVNSFGGLEAAEEDELWANELGFGYKGLKQVLKVVQS